MTICRPTLSYDELSRDEVLRYAGMRSNGKASFPVELVDAAMENVIIYASPVVSFEKYDYDCSTQNIKANGENIRIESRMAGRHLEGSDEIICLALTLGREIDEMITKSFDDGKYAEGLLMDAAATDAVEVAATKVEQPIEQMAKAKGYKLRWRYSPGYGDWPIDAQRDMMRLTRAESIGISLSESLMLEPSKSITAVIGLAKGDSEHDIRRGCAGCGKVDCISRRVN